MTRLRWELARALRAIGVPGWAALVLLAACAAGLWGVASGMQRETATLEADGADLARRLHERAGRSVASALTPHQQLADFERRFSGEKSISGSLMLLNAAAQRHGVQLAQAEFKFVSEAREPLARYTIVLPVKCDYRALRHFTQDAMRSLPAMAMEEVSLRRGDAKSTQLEAQLRFVIFISKAG